MKILIIRFSSIGDILITTPIIRCIKKQLNAEVHYLCKENFSFVLESNPYIDKFLFKKKLIKEDLSQIRVENYDLIIDLQKSLYTRILTFRLGCKYISYNKLNIRKWLYVNLKIDTLPHLHLIDRYFESLKKINVIDDGNGLDYIITQHEYRIPKPYVAVVLGAAHKTKRIPREKVLQIIDFNKDNIVLIGGKDVYEEGEDIKNLYKDKCTNLCGKTSFEETATIIKNANKIYTGDTGIMHLAAALKKEIIVLWGNTTPKFGMYPYYGKNYDLDYISKEVVLSCRPCSKLGHSDCPKNHFRCMREQIIDI
jgi:heptosyltransferase-2